MEYLFLFEEGKKNKPSALNCFATAMIGPMTPNVHKQPFLFTALITVLCKHLCLGRHTTHANALIPMRLFTLYMEIIVH